MNNPNISELRIELEGSIAEANRVDERNTFNDLEVARSVLHEARGIYKAMVKLDLLTDKQTAIFGEDLERIAEKLDYLRKEKRRNNGMVWRH